MVLDGDGYVAGGELPGSIFAKKPTAPRRSTQRDVVTGHELNNVS